MHVTRSRMVRALRAMDRHDRFRILYPVNAEGEDIYVHAKIEIIDDWLLRVGSSNIDQRSMGFDTECDVAVASDDATSRAFVRASRSRLLAEHLDSTPEQVEAAIARHGVIGAIDRLNRAEGRGLRDLPLRKESWLGSLLADTRFFDPRYRHSAQARVGLTSRHVMIGAAVLLGAAVIWQRNRRDR